ncbi:MAG: hypothetical protein GX673_02605 [Gammaproteobacteria bacterium]|nr:hypothetical protein [Gammaproteobacteria bacterium]
MPSREQPKVFKAIKAGFDNLSSHVWLLLFPIALDLFFLFGKRLLISDQINAFLASFIPPEGMTAELLATWEDLKLLLTETIKNFSLTSFLRTFPIGIPSLLSNRNLSVSPLGEYSTAQVSASGTLLTVLGFSVIGFLLGVLFLYAIRKSTKINQTKDTWSSFSKQLLSLILILLVLIVIALVIFVPALIIISVLTVIIPFLGSITTFLFSFIILSAGLPLIFTAHEILLYGTNFQDAIKESIKVVRPTNMKTSSFLFLVLIVSYFTNFLWQIPEDGSYMLLISILGHALVSTILWIASFHFYEDARNCVHRSIEEETLDSEQLSV